MQERIKSLFLEARAREAAAGGPKPEITRWEHSEYLAIVGAYSILEEWEIPDEPPARAGSKVVFFDNKNGFTV